MSKDRGQQNTDNKRELSRQVDGMVSDYTNGLLPPPHNEEAERAIAGAMIRFPDRAIGEIVGRLTPDDFHGWACRCIFESVIELDRTSKPIDIVTVAESLGKRGLLQEIGGAPAIVHLYEEIFSPENLAYYIGIVEECSARRRLLRLAIDLQRGVWANTTPLELIAETEASLSKIGSMKGESPATLQSATSRFLEIISERAAGTSNDYCPSGFSELDNLRVLRPGWMVVLAAKTSGGKTAFSSAIVEHIAMHVQRPCLVISLEMTSVELAERMTCSLASVPSDHLVSKAGIEQNTANVVNAANRLGSGATVEILDKSVNVTELRAYCRRFMLRHPTAAVIVCDYLQLVPNDRHDASKAERVGEISRALKMIAMELKVCVIALSQFNRRADQDDRQPQLSDLKESSGIEQDANCVLILHDDDQGRPDVRMVIVAKNRSGPCIKFHVAFQRSITRFTDLAPQWETNPDRF